MNLDSSGRDRSSIYNKQGGVTNPGIITQTPFEATLFARGGAV